jgi:hypothetical protein
VCASLVVTSAGGVEAQRRARPGREPANASAAAGGGSARDARAEEEARRLFEAGRAAFEAARYADAIAYFEAAYARSARPKLLYDIGVALERLGRRRDARAAYEAYLDVLPDAENATEVRTRLDVLGRPESVQAPSAAEAARAANRGEAGPADGVEDGTWRLAGTPGAPSTERREDGPILTRWWFWTAVGVVVAGAAVSAALWLGGAGATALPVTGAVGPGGVVYALGGP